jgi:hypothetical protein
MPSDKDQHATIERWLRDEVVPTYDRHKSDPGSAAPLDQSIARLHDRMEKVAAAEASPPKLE